MSAEPTTPRSTDICRVPDAGPPPKLHPAEGCLPLEEEIALAKWIARVELTREALVGCSLVQLAPEEK